VYERILDKIKKQAYYTKCDHQRVKKEGTREKKRESENDKRKTATNQKSLRMEEN
jgi:hypothetical protein